MGAIYTLATKWRSIEEQLEESGGEVTEEIAQELLDVEGATDEAVTALICLTKEREATNNFITQEVALLNKRKKANEGVIETYENTLSEIVRTYGTMGSNGHKKYEVGAHKVTFRESKSTNVNEDLIKYIVSYIWGAVSARFKRYKAGDDYKADMSSALCATLMTKAIMNFTPELLQVGTQEKVDEETGETTVVPYYTNVTQDDVATVKVKVVFEVPISELLLAEENDEGFDLVAAAVHYNATITPVVSKTELKEQLTNRLLSIAKIDTNANLQIK